MSATTATAPTAPTGVQHNVPALLKMRQGLVQYLQRVKHIAEKLASFRSRMEDLRKCALAGDLTAEEVEGLRLLAYMAKLSKLVDSVNDLQKTLALHVKLQHEKLMKVHAALRQQQTPRRARLQQAPASQDCHIVCNLRLPQIKLTVMNERGFLQQLIAGRVCVLMLDPPGRRSFTMMMARQSPLGSTEVGRKLIDEGMQRMYATINDHVKAMKTRAAAGRAATEAAAVATPVNPAGAVVASVKLRRSARLIN